jgi:lysozyme
MQTSPDGIALMHYFEGCRLTAYPDPATGGKPYTIGYGDTGPDVVPGLTITQDEANIRFAKRLAREFEPGVNAAVHRDLEQRQFDGLVCLAYNIGLANFRSSTLLRKLNAGDIDGASAQFLVWDKAAGRSMLGLRRRRVAERALFDGMSVSLALSLSQATT